MTELDRILQRHPDLNTDLYRRIWEDQEKEIPPVVRRGSKRTLVGTAILGNLAALSAPLISERISKPPIVEAASLKPDLVIELIEVVTQTGSGIERLYVTVRNDSDVDTTDSTSVDAYVDGVLYHSGATIPPLRAHWAYHTWVADLNKKPCEVRAIADPNNTVDESNEANNERTDYFVCSASPPWSRPYCPPDGPCPPPWPPNKLTPSTPPPIPIETLIP